MQDTPKPIAYLIASKHVVCLECIADYYEDGPYVAPMYPVNIGQYAQGCHDCGKLIVAPVSAYWPELFAPKDCRTCEASGRKARDYRELLAQVAKA